MMITRLEQECRYDVLQTYKYGNIMLWARVLRIRYMGMLIYVILHRLCLVNEQNAMINLKNDMVKNIHKRNDLKKNPVILALKKSSRYSLP